MGTPFSEVYEMFLAQVDNLKLSLMDDQELEEYLSIYLKRAVASFVPHSKKELLMVDYDSEYFPEDLDLMEKSLISQYMLKEYVTPFVISDDTTTSHLNSRDYRTYSPSAHMQSLVAIKKDIQKNINLELNNYIAYYYIKDLKGK